MYIYSDRVADENVNSIGHWTKTREILVWDERSGVAVDLYKRIDELTGLKTLSSLILSIQAKTYKQIKVATFIEKLVGLERLHFLCDDMSKDQMKEFYENNEIPSSWRKSLRQDTILYHKKEQ